MNKKTIFFFLAVAVVALPVVTLAACGDEGGGNPTLDRVILNIKDAALSVGVGLAVVGFIVAGILYVTAAGAPNRMETAKKALIAAVIGTALVALAQGANIVSDIFCNIIG